ncbi:IcmT/TraK family protein [Vibrio owensii]|uniref:IcmT/TraK family protein n=1 Tax=Vibrio harveyi group TaxID=717610 RepID=UPI003CC52EA3
MAIRDASKGVKFIFLDGTVVIPLLLVMVNPSQFTFICCIGASLVLTFLSRRGMNLHMLSRKLRSLIIGNVRNIRPPWRA